MSLRSWVRAARPLAQANIAPPVLFGQALAWGLTGRFSWGAFALVLLWGVLDQVFIVFANDVADAPHDRADARTPFSGGSGVIPEGLLSRGTLARAALVVFAVLGAVSVGLAITASAWALAAWLAAGGLVWAYSFPPLRMSYRGGGELLQGLGVGAVLPLLGFVAQAQALGPFPRWVLIATVPLAMAGNVATALPDEVADRRALKRTWPVRMGRTRAAWACLGLTVVALYAALALAVMRPETGATPAVALAALPLLGALFVNVRTRRGALVFVVLHGATTQLFWLGWGLALILA
ncbi:MAG: prenyltransferase [Myxococcales bacterium]|nr:prenyltransferase [Myxococcales bacterium]